MPLTFLSYKDFCQFQERFEVKELKTLVRRLSMGILIKENSGPPTFGHKKLKLVVE